MDQPIDEVAKHNSSYEQLIKRDEQLVETMTTNPNYSRTEKWLRWGKERSRTPRFTLVHPSSMATSSPLPTRNDFH